MPPRPKPGRKPATDTPPTKRKAQNRAAQRAFRERRAARVGELEEQMKEVEENHESQLDDLRSYITELEQSLEKCQAELASWISRCQKLEADLAQANQSLSKSAQPDTVGCGNCTLDTHCQCIDDVVKGMDDAESGEPSTKKIKTEASNEMEIDFTQVFARPTQRQQSSIVIHDPCGFCSDGTPCICAEMAVEQERLNASRPSSPGPRRQLAQFTPPPSEGDVSIAVVPNRCASGPGTCAQCQADPNSTLFCKSLAASRGGGCCGGKGADGGCCQTAAPSRTTRSRAGNPALQLPVPNDTRSTITLSCADAYTALSRHTGYEKATGDMASWMPKLHANTGTEGRPAMEIDAANVMAVLKDFDRRFGANK